MKRDAATQTDLSLTSTSAQLPVSAAVAAPSSKRQKTALEDRKQDQDATMSTTKDTDGDIAMASGTNTEADAIVPVSSGVPKVTIVTMSNKADTTLEVIIDGVTRQFKVEAAKTLANFAKWWSTQNKTKAAITYRIDFTDKPLKIRAPANDLLDAVQVLCKVMHDLASGKDGCDGAVIYRISVLDPVLGLAPNFRDWVYDCVRAFLIRAIDDNQTIPAGEWEQVLAACAYFRWENLYVHVAARLAYVCHTAVDDTTGDRYLVPPAGTRLDATVCGEATISKSLPVSLPHSHSMTAATRHRPPRDTTSLTSDRSGDRQRTTHHRG